jgi:UDP-arabinose 4-epimerase
MKAVLVTGGAGYIGSHACKALAQSGFRPVVLDNLSTGHQCAVKWGPLVKGDIADRDLVRRTLEQYHVEAVMHFAANASVAESMKYPFRYLHDNMVGSLRLLEAMNDVRVRRIVVSSTCATYGIPSKVPISESTPQLPVNPYGESKLAVERALGWYQSAHGLRWTALRYFNAAGADHEKEIGEVHDPETHLIPLVIGAALGFEPPVRVMGTDYPTHDGTAIRDYIHVEDLAKAHIVALDYLASGGESTAINLGTACGHSVLEVIKAVERVSGQQVPREFAARREGDPPKLVADNHLAQKLLQWTPRYTSLEEIVGTAWAWHTSQVRAAAAVAAN